MARKIPILKCPKCRRENSHKTCKCVECGHLFFTNEELAARYPPGRGGPHWWQTYERDGTPKDVAEKYLREVGKTWNPDPDCRSPDAWIAPDGSFWPCGSEQHVHLAPVLVAHYDLYGEPTVNEVEGRGGQIDRDEHGWEYYKETVRYPNSSDILKESGFLSLGFPGGRRIESAIYNTKEPTEAQRATVEKWRVIHKVNYIHYYDKRKVYRKSNKISS